METPITNAVKDEDARTLITASPPGGEPPDHRQHTVVVAAAYVINPDVMGPGSVVAFDESAKAAVLQFAKVDRRADFRESTLAGTVDELVAQFRDALTRAVAAVDGTDAGAPAVRQDGGVASVPLGTLPVNLYLKK